MKPNRPRRLSLRDRLNDALNAEENAVCDRIDTEQRLDALGRVVAGAWSIAFGKPRPAPHDMDPAECAGQLRDWIRTVKTRPAASASVEATAVAVIENIARAAGIDMIAVRMANPSEVQALIYVGSLLAFPSLCEEMDMVKRKSRSAP